MGGLGASGRRGSHSFNKAGRFHCAVARCFGRLREGAASARWLSSGISRRGWQNSSRDSHRGRARGDIGDDQAIGGYHSAVSYGHHANDGTVAADEDVVAYRRSTWPRPCAYRAYVVDCTISPDLGVTMHSNEPNVGNEQAWANPSVRMNVDMRYHRK
jgi:hypothetical protein